MVTDPLYEAMLRIAALRKGSFPPSLDYVSGPFDCFVGPLPGLGTGFFDLVTKSPKSAGSFDTVARALIDEQFGRGFVLAGVHSRVFLLTLLPGPLVLSRLREALQSYVRRVQKGRAQY